jgi:hypothetical protein
MKQQLRIGSNPIRLKGDSFGRAYLLVDGVGASTLVNTDFSLANLRIQLEVSQAGVKDGTAFNAVGPFIKGLLDNQDPTAWTNAGLANSVQTLRGILRAGSTTQSTFIVPILDGGYILKGDDYINFNIDILPAFYSANVTDSSAIYLVTEEANGIVQADVNIPIYEPITTDRQSPSYTYDGVSEVSLINSVNNYTLATNPFQSIGVKSSYVNDTFDNATLDSLRYLRIRQSATHGCSKIYNVEPDALHNVELNLAINTTLVTAGSQFVYVSKVITTPNLALRAIHHADKIATRNAEKQGLGHLISNIQSRKY